ncbi:MAG TPA: NAD(P)-dependent oxidoreductase, partial [Microbacteriaceae bacterium]|nr:NAD(P)-dependent oxidoreductase [Microbacteriaceae bacterium]
NANAVAEFAVGLMIAAMRGLVTSAESVRAGQWSRITGPELSGATVGIAGFGTIGRLVARRLSGFDVRLIAWDPYPDEEAARALGVELVSLDALVSGADVLSLHVPLLPETRHFVNADLLARMKPGSYLVNTARGGLVDEDALVDALSSGRLRGAALDVFAAEPLPVDHPLRTLPGVVATGHVGAESHEAYAAISVANATSIIAALTGPAASRKELS